ncbi:MAG: hypothetical protein J9259_00930 [Thermoplasmata archaeon YP2-bin.285]|uniref:Uncharacterized protein n=1 Tax=Candidatus Sysuiplasma superficiale TaxID=2823368 RepID=A0A8J7YN17_9ARCH|nr:hypothetical protein [Candidatus Sysuiplasma superficiale]
MEIYNEVSLAIIVPFLILYAIYRIDPRYLVALSLILLISSAAESAVGNSAVANDIAIVFFYCLSAGVVLIIVDDYIKSRKPRGNRLKSALSGLYAGISFYVKRHRRVIAEFIFPSVVFASLSLLILGPLLYPGYVLVTDMVFGPRAPLSGLYGMSAFIGGGNALSVFDYLLYFIMPGWAVEKIYLFLILFFSGLTMFRFSRHFGLSGPSAYFSSILYSVNPFVYARMLAGAWGLLFAYSLVPLAFLLFIRLVDLKEMNNLIRKAAETAIVFSVLAVFDIHTFILSAILCVLYYVVMLIHSGRRETLESLVRSMKAVLILLAFLVLLNLYWLLYSPYSAQNIIGSFNFLDAIAFASSPTVFNNTMLSIAAMYGFFRTGYPYPITDFPSLIVIFFLFLLLSVLGFLLFCSERKRGPVTVTLGAAAVISVVIATGISSPLTAGIYTFLYDNVPLFNGFREPQKFVALLVFAYAFLIGLSILHIQSFLSQTGRRGRYRGVIQIAAAIAIVFILISPFIYSYMEVNSFDGQLTSVQYPSSWYRAEAIMNDNTTDYSVLVFPWHGYMYYNWSKTKFASPFNSFFRQTVIYGGQDTYLSGQGDTSLYSPLILSVLKERNSISHLGNLLSLMDVKYVFLSKSADYWNYSFLYRQSDLKLVENSSTCALFENMHPVSRAYIVSRIAAVSGYPQLINASSSVNMLSYAWVISSSVAISKQNYTNGSYLLLNSTKISDADYSIRTPGFLGLDSRNYLVFIPPSGYDSGWRTSPALIPYVSENTSSGIASPGYLVYQITGAPSQLRVYFAPFSDLLYGYVVSLVSFVILVAAVFIVPVIRVRRFGLASHLFKRIH